MRARIDQLTASDERLGALADGLVARWEQSRYAGMSGQFDLGGVLAPLFATGAVAGTAGIGRITPGQRLRGAAEAVTVAPVKTSSPIAPPTSLAEAFRRFPKSASAQIAVERYVMTDGTSRYLAYLTGTRAALGYGGEEPWDMKSNQQLYTGDRSASYEATRAALAAAGAQPGDEVNVVAHSQSGMIAAHLSMEGEFDVRVQLTAGSPVELVLDADQTIIQLRHTDDVVSALAGGGSPGGTGSADSFVASRIGDPAVGIQDVMLRTHQLDAYIETAELVDASDDPRVRGLDAFWSGLNEAVTIESTEYRAERVR